MMASGLMGVLAAATTNAMVVGVAYAIRLRYRDSDMAEFAWVAAMLLTPFLWAATCPLWLACIFA